MPIKSNFLSNNIVKTFNLRWSISMPLLLRLKMGFGVRGGFQYSYKADNYMEKEKHQSCLFGITPVGSPVSLF